MPAEIILPESNCTELSSLYEAVTHPGASYLWDFGDASTVDHDSDDAIKEVIWPYEYQDTTVTISLTVTSANGCISTTTESVTVHRVTDGDIQGDMIVVEGTTRTYTGPTAASYEWSVIEGDAHISSGFNCLLYTSPSPRD